MKTAIHDVSVWLPRTKTWLYNEISELAGDWSAWVYRKPDRESDRVSVP